MGLSCSDCIDSFKYLEFLLAVDVVTVVHMLSGIKKFHGNHWCHMFIICICCCCLCCAHLCWDCCWFIKYWPVFFLFFCKTLKY